MKSRDLLLGLLCTFIWGLNYPITKIMISDWPPLLAISLRLLIAGLVMCCFIGFPKDRFFVFFRVALFYYTLTFGLLCYALKTVPASVAAVLSELEVPFGTILGLIFFKEQVRVSQYGGLVLAFIGLIIGASWTPILSQIGILSIVDTIGSFFGPIFGIIITDYYFINKAKINNKDLYSSDNEGSYFFSNGWHIKGIYALIIGFIFSASTIWNINMNFLQSYSWLIGASMSSITYYLLVSKQTKYD